MGVAALQGAHSGRRAPHLGRVTRLRRAPEDVVPRRRVLEPAGPGAGLRVRHPRPTRALLRGAQLAAGSPGGPARRRPARGLTGAHAVLRAREGLHVGSARRRRVALRRRPVADRTAPAQPLVHVRGRGRARDRAVGSPRDRRVTRVRGRSGRSPARERPDPARRPGRDRGLRGVRRRLVRRRDPERDRPEPRQLLERLLRLAPQHRRLPQQHRSRLHPARARFRVDAGLGHAGRPGRLPDLDEPGTARPGRAPRRSRGDRASVSRSCTATRSAAAAPTSTSTPIWR